MIPLRRLLQKSDVLHLIAADDLEHIWQKASVCLQELADAKIFLTGGTGFFGCWLLESFCYAKKHFNLSTEIVVLTRNPENFREKAPHLASAEGVELYQGDIRSFQFPDKQFTHVIHGATEASAKLNDEAPLVMLDTIIDGTRRVLDFTAYCQAKKFLLISSGAVYGKQPADMTHVPESYLGACDPLQANSAYGVGKYTAEQLSILYAKKYKFEAKIARCFAFVGPYLPLTTHFAIGNFIQNALDNESLNIAGDGSPFRSYLYAADLVIWLWTILCKGQPNVAYNVGSEEAIDIENLAKLIAGPRNLALKIAKQRDGNSKALRYVPSTQLAQTQLGLQQWIDLPTAIEKTIQWKQIFQIETQ